MYGSRQSFPASRPELISSGTTHSAHNISCKRSSTAHRTLRKPAPSPPTAPPSPPAVSRKARASPPEPPQSSEMVRRSEEHTSELQSRQYLVCRLLLEKKKKKNTRNIDRKYTR